MNYTEQDDEITSVNELDMNGSYTAADYLKWRIEEMLELIGGKVFRMSPAPILWHQRIYSDLYKIFLRYEDQFGQCTLWQAPTDVYLVHPGEDYRKTKNVVQPDLFIVCDQSKLQEKGCIGAPDFVVEILSPSTAKKDASLKLELYRDYAVREYWMVSVSDRLTLSFLLDENGEYQPQKPAVEGHVISLRDFPNVKVDVEELFEKVPKAN